MILFLVDRLESYRIHFEVSFLGLKYHRINHFGISCLLISLNLEPEITKYSQTVNMLSCKMNTNTPKKKKKKPSTLKNKSSANFEIASHC